MMNWLIGIFSFRNKAVKKITQYQKQESMPDFLNTNTRLQLLSQRKKIHEMLPGLERAAVWGRLPLGALGGRLPDPAIGFCLISYLCDLFDCFLRCFEWSLYFAKFFFVILNLLWTAAGSRWCSFRFRLYLIYKKEILKSNWLSNSSRAQQFIWVAK